MIQIDNSKRLQIFDLGNVLIKVDARKTLEAFARMGMPPIDGVISNSHAAGGIFSLYCDGKVGRDEFIAGVRKMCGVTGTDGEIIDAWNAMLGDYSTESIETIQRVKAQGHAVALLSNCNELHTTTCRARFPKEYGEFDNLFDGIFFSQEIGMSKPKPETWLLVLEQMGYKAEEAAFYDDSQINVDAARALGINGIRTEI